MDILMLVDRLEAVINGGWRPPMMDKVMIDEQEAHEVLDLMRTAIPEEIKQSRRVNQDREQLIAEAQADANRLMAQAEERLQLIVSEDEVVRAADERAQQIHREAQREADDIRRGADDYAYQVLQELDARLDRMIAEARNGMHALVADQAEIDRPEYEPEPVYAGQS